MSPEQGSLSITELKVELDEVLQQLQLRRSERLRQKRLREERAEDERETEYWCEYRAKQLAAVPAIARRQAREEALDIFWRVKAREGLRKSVF